MRYIKDLIIEKVVVNVVDNKADEAIYTSKVLTINEDVEEFVRKHILKSLNDEDTYKARFLSNEVEVFKIVHKQLTTTNKFLEVSKELTTKMFNIIKKSDITSCDLLFVQYVANDQRCFAVLKLDYQDAYMHNILSDVSGSVVNISSEALNLPGTGQRLKKCVFFSKLANDDLDVIVINRKEKIDEDNQNYFLDKFLQVVIVNDDTNKTRKLKPVIEKWTQRNLSNHLAIATKVRESVNEKLLKDSYIDFVNLTSELFDELPEIKKSFEDTISLEGYKENSKFNIDKKYVEKKVVNKHIKTDTGLVIKGDFDIFKDNHKFSYKDNGDGTFDYMIKNVRSVVEK